MPALKNNKKSTGREKNANGRKSTGENKEANGRIHGKVRKERGVTREIPRAPPQSHAGPPTINKRAANKIQGKQKTMEEKKKISQSKIREKRLTRTLNGNHTAANDSRESNMSYENTEEAPAPMTSLDKSAIKRYFGMGLSELTVQQVANKTHLLQQGIGSRKLVMLGSDQWEQRTNQY